MIRYGNEFNQIHTLCLVRCFLEHRPFPSRNQIPRRYGDLIPTPSTGLGNPFCLGISCAIAAVARSRWKIAAVVPYEREKERTEVSNFRGTSAFIFFIAVIFYFDCLLSSFDCLHLQIKFCSCKSVCPAVVLA